MTGKNWWQRKRHHLLTLEDTPEAIALGVALGIFFGFTPLFGLKTLLAILFAWFFGGNELAAALAVALHDLILPFLPLIMRWEYDLGFWLLSSPHRFPPAFRVSRHHFIQWFHWTTFFTVGAPLLVGAAVIGLPVAALAYWGTVGAVRRYRHRQQQRQSRAAETERR